MAAAATSPAPAAAQFTPPPAKSPSPLEVQEDYRRTVRRAREALTCVEMPGAVPAQDPEAYWCRRFEAEFMPKEAFGTDKSLSPAPPLEGASPPPPATADDDLLFYVLPGPFIENKSLKEEFVVRRKDQIKSLYAISDPSVHWEKSYFLNLLTHFFEYKLTVLVCHNDREDTQKEFQISTRVQKPVFASPSQVRMDTKSTEVTPAWPFLYFSVAEFDSAWNDIHIDKYLNSLTPCFPPTYQ
eukprot:TRINITY_DN3094_c0_g1_i3.p1 TRINITY_DN3094_c0_g1~~TRINITY_DN3094_c0_g1_i3.p1  ORF type:complete len:251 (+),score=69.49 TRINITY_DN3094_c0_g1_i3:33-755(+)